MFNPTRDQVRQFFCATWEKHQKNQPLEGAEIAAGELCIRHPEYHSLLSSPEKALTGEWHPEHGVMNPFLHLSLHLAISEQISIDQPPGIRGLFEALQTQIPLHDAEHVLLECLGETIWEAQHNGKQMDGTGYLEKVRRRAGKANKG